MTHFRDARPGRFYLHADRPDEPRPQPSETPAFLRFAAKHGVAVNLWKGEGAEAHQLVHAAGLGWPVLRKQMTVPAGPGLMHDTQVKHYHALVRPDNEQIMSVVTSAYAPADNQWVAEAVENYVRPFHPQPAMIGAVGFGRAGERTLFSARVSGDQHRAICLLAHNTHGGEGAVRFEIVEVDRARQITCVLGTSHAARTYAHTGDLRKRLAQSSRHGALGSWIEKYLDETAPQWARLEDTFWTRRHTAALIDELWGRTPSLAPRQAPNGNEVPVPADWRRHPGHHLPDLMDGIADAASAYYAICDWIDNRSEGCERGDFTKDRDERLALGAGNKIKRDAWRWIRDNT